MKHAVIKAKTTALGLRPPAPFLVNAKQNTANIIATTPIKVTGSKSICHTTTENTITINGAVPREIG